MTGLQMEQALDMYSRGFLPKDIALALGLKRSEVGTLCTRHQTRTYNERRSFIKELTDLGYIWEEHGFRTWQWLYKGEPI